MNDSSTFFCSLFNPSYILTSEYQQVRLAAETERTAQQCNNNAPVPYEPQCLITATNSRWLSWVLISVPVIETWMIFPSKQRKGSWYNFVFSCSFLSIYYVEPTEQWGWSGAWSGSAGACGSQSLTDVQMQVMMSDRRKRLPPVIVRRCPWCWKLIEQLEGQ